MEFAQECWLTICGAFEVAENAVANARAHLGGVKQLSVTHRAAQKHVLITGGNSGVGLATAQELAKHGAHVTITSRSLRRAQAAARNIEQDVRKSVGLDCKIACEELDLASLKDVKRFCARLKALPAMDIIICNAGLMCPEERQVTADGMEVQWQTNHLGHFVLAATLAKRRLEEGKKKRAVQRLRLVLVSSMAHIGGRINYADLQAEHKYNPFKWYAQSKLANVMTALEIDARSRLISAQHRHASLAEEPPAVSAVAVHPGLVDTPLARQYFTNDYLWPWIRPVARPVMRALFPFMLLSPGLSARFLMQAALADDTEVAGRYVAHDKVASPAQSALRAPERCRLWDVSCDLAGINDPLPVRAADSFGGGPPAVAGPHHGGLI